MNGIALFDALARLDEQFIDCICGEVSCPPAKARRSSHRLRTIVAVCVGLFLVAGTVLVPRLIRPRAASGLMLMAVDAGEIDSTDLIGTDGFTLDFGVVSGWIQVLKDREEFTQWNPNSDYFDETQPETLEIEIMGETVSGTYKESLFMYGSFIPCHRYDVDDLSEFYIDSKGTLVMYVWKPFDRKNAGERISEEEAIALACELFDELTPYKATDYSVEYNYVDNMQINEIVFQKFLNGIPTADMAYIDLYRDGTPIGFSSYALGTIPNHVERAFDLDSVDQRVIKRCRELKEDTEKNIGFDFVEYSDWSHIITIDQNGQYYVIVSVTMKFMRSEENCNISYCLSPYFLSPI